MLDKFFDLVQSDDFGNEFNSFINKLDSFKNQFNVSSLFNNVSSFRLKDGIYELTMDVENGTNADNIEINLDKNNVISIKYQVKKDMCEHMVSVKETLPEDANVNTLDAEIKNNKLIVTVEQEKNKIDQKTKIAINK